MYELQMMREIRQKEEHLQEEKEATVQTKLFGKMKSKDKLSFWSFALVIVSVLAIGGFLWI